MGLWLPRSLCTIARLRLWAAERMCARWKLPLRCWTEAVAVRGRCWAPSAPALPNPSMLLLVRRLVDAARAVLALGCSGWASHAL